MFLQIDDFLTASEVTAIAGLAGQAKFISGRHSNPHNITKNNVIVDPGDPHGQQAAQIMLTAFRRSEQARDFAFPQRIAIPQILRYSQGMSYGAHTDAAFLPVGPEPLRSDVSSTIFISDPAEYTGGELTVHLGAQSVRIKGRPGQAVLYPSTTLHEVAPVTSGERVVMITFIESQIADQAQRDILYNLNEVRALEGLKMDWGNRMRLEYVSVNLHRMWAR